MSDIVLSVENIWKQYRLGVVGSGNIREDIARWWAGMRGKEDPTLKIGAINNRENLNSEYVWALREVSFEVKRGEVLGIIGKNGAGKSTLLKILSKVTTPTKGHIKTKGRIASLLEVGTGFHPELTGRENIFLNGAILGMDKPYIKSKLEEIVTFSGIGNYIDTPVKRYSSGMYVRLAFAVAAHLEPEILIIDEVLAVGDAEFQKKCLGKMQDVSGQGRTVLFVSHNMPIMSKLCQNGVLLKHGQVEIISHIENVIEKYNTEEADTTEMTIQKVTLDSFQKTPEELKNILTFLSVEFYEKRQNNVYATNEPIDFLIKLKNTKSLKNFNINVGINRIDDTPVGLSFNQADISLHSPSIFEVLLSLKEHNLSKGKYYINLSLSFGNHTDTGIEAQDIIVKVLFFEILYNDMAKKDMITVWSQSWGNINFQNTEIIKIN